MHEQLLHRPSPVEIFLQERRKSLELDYRTPDGEYAESCTGIAVDVARLLIAEGKHPELMRAQGLLVPGSTLNHYSVYPKQYNGRLPWGAHIFCAADGMAYDPLVGKPVSLLDYPQEVFMTPVEINTAISALELPAFIKRGEE
jgi:hypothetical protein